MVLRRVVRAALGAIVPALVLVCLLAAVPGHAAPEAPDVAQRRAQAGQLADEALALLEQRRCQDALAKFREADETLHSPVFVLFMARSELCLGNLVEAHALLKRVVGEKLAEYAPDTFWKAKRDAQKELRALDPRVPRWTLRVVGAPLSEVTVKVDGKTVDAVELRTPAPINPGEHVVAAETADGRQGEESFTASAGELSTVEIDLGEATVEPPPDDGQPEQSEGWWTSPYLPAGIAYGVGGAGLIMGVITGAIFVDRADDLKERCPDDRCAPEDEEEGEAVSTLGTVSTIGFVVAGVGAVAGTVLLLTIPNGDEDASGEALNVRAGPTGVIVSGTF